MTVDSTQELKTDLGRLRRQLLLTCGGVELEIQATDGSAPSGGVGDGEGLTIAIAG